MQPQPWIKPRVKELGKTLKGLAQAMGLDSARITEIMAGTRRVQPQEVAIMAAYLQLPYETVYSRLFGSVPSVAGDVRGARPVQAVQVTDDRIHPIRDLGGGVVELSTATIGLAFPAENSIPKPFNCYVTTDHMVPVYEEGDDLLINPALPVTNNCDVLLIAVRDGEPARAMLRRLIDKTDAQWIVKQWNPVKTEKLDRRAWRALRVEGVKRKA